MKVLQIEAHKFRIQALDGRYPDRRQGIIED
jgi:hypothetical protein